MSNHTKVHLFIYPEILKKSGCFINFDRSKKYNPRKILVFKIRFLVFTWIFSSVFTMNIGQYDLQFHKTQKTMSKSSKFESIPQSQFPLWIDFKSFPKLQMVNLVMFEALQSELFQNIKCTYIVVDWQLSIIM